MMRSNATRRVRAVMASDACDILNEQQHERTCCQCIGALVSAREGRSTYMQTHYRHHHHHHHRQAAIPSETTPARDFISRLMWTVNDPPSFLSVVVSIAWQPQRPLLSQSHSSGGMACVVFILSTDSSMLLFNGAQTHEGFLSHCAV